MKFCWVTINVSNMERSIDFYQNIAGLPVTRKFVPDENMEIAFFGMGETQVELVYKKQETGSVVGSDISLGFVTDAVDRLIEALRGKKIPVEAGPFQPNPGTRFFYILDPDGVRIQFVENIPH